MKKVLTIVLLFIGVASYAQSRKISVLPTATNLTGSFIPIIQDSLGQYVNRKFAGDSLSTGGGAGTPLANNGLSGFIAQDVEKVLPEMVTTKRGIKHLKNVTYLEPYIIATIQEMHKEIVELRKEVKELKKESTGNHRPRYDRTKK